jgi:hypothetical protein
MNKHIDYDLLPPLTTLVVLVYSFTESKKKKELWDTTSIYIHAFSLYAPFGSLELNFILIIVI